MSSRKWNREFKDSLTLVTGSLFSGDAAPEAEICQTFASQDQDIEWRVKLAFAFRSEGDGWRMDAEICPFSCTARKGLVTVMAKGQVSLQSYACSQCHRAVGSSQSYCCNRYASLEWAVKSEFLLSESCCFRLENVTFQRSALATATVGNQTVSLLTLRFDLQHFTDEKVKEFQPGPSPFMGPNLKDLLESGNMSDVTFVVDGEEVKAHSQVLGAVSDVFKSMFSMDTQDRRTGRVEVPDASASCFREMLRCVYLNAVPTWGATGDGARSAEEEEELLLGLLFLAEKYALAGLGKHCQCRLLSSLRLDNVVERLKVVNVIRPALVPAITFPFLRSHLKEILAQDAWDALMRDNLELAARVMHSAMMR